MQRNSKEGELCFHTPANMRTSVNLCRGEARLALNNVCLGFLSSTLYYTPGEQIFVAFNLSFEKLFNWLLEVVETI